MPQTNQKIGRLIYQIRQDRGLTQAALAKKLGTSQSAVNRIEHGKQNLSLETLGRISDVLNKQIISLGEGAVNLRIEGGQKLKGEVELKTSKNATVAILCASLLNKGTTKIKRVPRIEEVNRMIEVLSSIGVHIRWLEDNSLEVKPPKDFDPEKMNKAAARKTRIVIMLAGALMHEVAEFKIPYAGGCELGRRTVLPHIYALEEFGTEIIAHDGHYNIKAEPKLPKRPVVLYEMSDVATENALLAAAGFDGETIIKMASPNYMGQDLCHFLQKLGVKIEGVGSSTLKVQGLKHIKKNVAFTPSEDPVEAMTFIAAAVTTNSGLTIKRVPVDFMEMELLKLEKMGLRFKLGKTYKSDNGHTNLADLVIYPHNGGLKAPEEKLHPLPGTGLNIDNLPYFVPIVAVAKGRTLIHDWVYEDRALMYTEMKKLGVDLELADPHRVFINGPTRWRAADIVAPSGLRPAVILLIGMLATPGVSMLRNVYTINRGYEDLAARLNDLGANISIMHEL
ncbi:UDP-N-acetylglucosamine 1-carboxyvinyltransferase [Candidatus Saccharibacteria bacterium RIFCSPHIGHO2_12_FULL_47_16b]|nr:MAG: UDP-N-acetylglucosamine 1-carboxyvinyltransferase [Candidatus Saccharibacteria bacterium RIFCSPHIGHO2_12_FULL_47_16b]